MIKTAIIEDSKAIASIYLKYLEGPEFDVQIFGSTVSEVERLCLAKGIDIIVCPSFPKFQNGPGIAMTIKAEPDFAGVGFILSTTMQKGTLKTEWDFKDINGLLLKPFDREMLVTTLRKAAMVSSQPVREKKLVLVVDDSPAVQKVLSAELISLGLDVLTASNGAQGFDMAREHLPDLIFTDVEMPVMNGFELCLKISRDPLLTNTPMVVVSGTIDDSQFKKGFKSGVLDFLKKPISQEALAYVVKTILFKGKSSSWGTALVLSQDQGLGTIVFNVLRSLNFYTNVITDKKELEIYLGVSIPNIIILDLSDELQKLEACRSVRQLVGDNTPVIIAVVDEADRNNMNQCFKYGATELVTKPFGRDELEARIENHIKIQKLQAELVQKNKILEILAYEDKLTGLMNRRFFDETLEKELNRAESNQVPTSLLMLDLDHFKLVNDTYGHDIGDRVLRDVASILIKQVQNEGIPCRYGGEEFCIIFPGLSLKEAFKIGERVRLKCAGHTIAPYGICQTISGGVASFPETSSRKTLMIHADQALYKAKEGGRNQVILFEE